MTAAIEIVFEDRDLLVVNKPSGISVHNTEDPENLLTLISKKIFPIHRLDKETSGIQLFALNSTAAREWSEEFESRNVVKIYRGILRGKMDQPSGIWNWKLTDKSEGRKNPEGVASARVPCETHFQVQKTNKYFSDCLFDLKTGRQHQIRKHAAIARHALVGDARYGDPAYNNKMAALYKTDRMFLHCQKIEIRGSTFQVSPPEIFDQLMD